MKTFKNILFATIITLFVTSCTDNSLEELIEVQEETSIQARSSDTGGTSKGEDRKR